MVAKGADVSSVAEMEKSTKTLRQDISDNGLQLTLGGRKLRAPKQAVAVDKVDVTKPVKEHWLTFKVV